VLCPHKPQDAAHLLEWFDGKGRGFRLQARTMVQAKREDGQELLGLNEIFVGHRGHQSARYRLRVGSKEERQSSSGFLLASGTGSTGWALSLALQKGCGKLLPEPEQKRGIWFSREPFPSRYTGRDLDAGILETGDAIEMDSEMEEGGTVFADGMEEDRVEFVFGQKLSLSLAPKPLNLVVPG
jgi:hypothetical protein